MRKFEHYQLYTVYRGSAFYPVPSSPKKGEQFDDTVSRLRTSTARI